MRTFLIAILLLAISAASAAPQDRAKPEGEYDVHRCTPKVMGRRDGKSPEFHFRKGETYRNSPLVTYEILESGEIAHAVLKRSSGVAEVDKYAMKSVQELKFNKRPGCGAIKAEWPLTSNLEARAILYA